MFMKDSEIDEACYPLTQPAAQVRFLRRKGVHVELKSNGRPLVVRSHAEATLSGQRGDAAQPAPETGTPQVPDREALMALLKGRNGTPTPKQPA